MFLQIFLLKLARVSARFRNYLNRVIKVNKKQTQISQTPTSNIGNFTTSESGSVQNENNTTGLIEVESHNLCLPNLLHRDLSSSSLAYGLPDLLLNQNETTGFSSSIQSK